MQQLVILLVINCSSTCFGRLDAHRLEIRLRFSLPVVFCTVVNAVMLESRLASCVHCVE
jgi:hypothetical protein